MKFKFIYDKLLEHYMRQEKIAQRDYNESLTRLEHEKSIYKSMYDEQEAALDRQFQLIHDPKGASLAEVVQIDNYVVGQKIRIAQQREVVINYTTIVEHKQEILIAAAKETKIFEKLKEKRKLEFKKLMKKREAKFNDELVVTRFARNKSGGDAA